jgi:hypothetical protein
MSYQNDPNINRRSGVRDNASYTGWIVGGLVTLALLIGLFTMFGRDNNKTNTASNNAPVTSTTNRPAAPSTTGSGTIAPATGVPATAPAR